MACVLGAIIVAGCGGGGGGGGAADPAAAGGAGTTGADTTGAANGAGTGAGAPATSSNGGVAAGAVTRAADGPALDGCGSFRSGRYFLVDTRRQGAMRSALLDAATGTLTRTGVADPKLALNRACDYSYDNGTARVTVGPAGLAMIRHAGTAAWVDIAIPEQVFAVADLAGSYNLITYAEAGAGLGATMRLGKLAVGADGSVTIADCGNGVGGCATPAPAGRIDADPAGGFVHADGSIAGRPLHALRGTDGRIALVIADPGGIAFAGAEVAQTLPVGGDVVRATEVMVGSTGAASELIAGDYLVAAVTAAQRTYERYRLGDGQADTVTVNTPRDGISYRAAGASMLLDGTMTPYPVQLMLPIDGIGLGLYGAVAATPDQGYLGLMLRSPAN